MSRLFAVFTVLAAAFADIKDCGSANAKFTITKLAMDPPNTVTPGQNTTLTLLYDNNYEVVTGGTATTSFSLNGIPFTPTIEDLCGKITCPLDIGPHDGSSWSEFPTGVSGKITTTVRWKDTAGTELLCVEATLRTAEKVKRWWLW